MKALFKIAAATLVSGSVLAHDMVPGAEQSQPILIKDATLHTVVDGIKPDTDLLFEAGEIVAIGANLTTPEGAQVIDASGKHVYPGLVAMDTTLGLVEIGAVRATDDQEEVGPIHPEVSGHIAYNSDSEIIPTIRYNGITHAQVVPQGDLIMGQSSLLHTDGWTWEDGHEKLNLGVHVNWPRASVINTWWERRTPAEQRKANAEALKRLYAAIDDAKAYADAKAAGLLDGHSKDTRWEAMLGLFDGSKKLYVHAEDKRQLEQAIELRNEYGFDMVLMGARDSWRIADKLAAENIPVVFGAPYGLPSRVDEAYDQAYSTPALLQAAGVDYAISYPGYWDIRNLAFAAGNAVAYGLNKEQALAAITLKPAQMMGVADAIGSLEVGKKASLIISEGDVLSHIEQDITHMFIDGRAVDLNNRHRQLYEKYQQKPE